MFLRRFSALALLMLSLGSTAAIASPKLSQTIAQTPPPQEPGPPMRDGGQLFEKLNLTAAQKQKIQAIRNQYQGQMTQRREAMRKSQQELMSLMSGTASESQIREKHRQVLAQGQQMAELQFDIMLAMRQVLTPDQRRQLAQMMQERRDTVKNPNRGGNRPQ